MISQCEQCRSQGINSSLYSYGGSATLLAVPRIIDEHGKEHVHDSNTHTVAWTCSNGHKFSETIDKHPCWCGWPDKQENEKPSALLLTPNLSTATWQPPSQLTFEPSSTPESFTISCNQKNLVLAESPQLTMKKCEKCGYGAFTGLEILVGPHKGDYCPACIGTALMMAGVGKMVVPKPEPEQKKEEKP